MSNFHAKIAYDSQNKVFKLTDVGSTNRTWLRLSQEGEQSSLHPLKVGDIIKIGSTVFVVKSPDITNIKTMPVINKQHSRGPNQPVPSYMQQQPQQNPQTFFSEEQKNDVVMEE